MPRVPQYSNLQTSIGGLPAPSIGPGPGEIVGNQMQQGGRAALAAGDAGARIALDMQQQVNQTRVNDALNQTREAINKLTYDPQGGFLNLKGRDALERPDGVALPDEYTQKLRETIGGVAGNLGNDQQRQLFQQHAAELMNGFNADVQRHMLGEFRSYSISVQDGTVKLAEDAAARSWNDPSKIQPSLDAARAAIYEKGRLSGWSAAQTDAIAQQTVSGVHRTAILSALENGNGTYAMGYLSRYREQMTGDDILKVQGHVNQQVWAGMAADAVRQATGDVGTRVVPTDFDRMVGITLQTESGNRRYGPDGKLLTSSAGAQGEMQVMPATARDPGMGVKPAQDDSPEELARVGRDYLRALVQKYGDPAKAWAAYNAGPGAVDKALKAVESEAGDYARRGETPGPQAWLRKLPAETQAYVAKNVAALGSGATGFPRATEADFVNAALAKLPPDAPPQLVKMTREGAVQQFTLMDKSRRDAEDQAVAGAMRALTQNGGRFSDLPTAVRAAIPPEKVDDVMNFAQRIFRGDDVTNPAVYQRLSDPALLRSMSDDQFFRMRGELSEADFKHFASERTRLLKPKGADDPGNADSAAIKTAVDENLRALRIDPSPKDDGGVDAARIGAIRKFVNDEVLRAQALSGKKFTDDEVRKKVGALFAQQGVMSHWIGADTAQQMLAMKASDIPSDVRDRLRADFKASGVPDPTDAQLLGAYWTAKSRTRELAKTR